MVCAYGGRRGGIEMRASVSVLVLLVLGGANIHPEPRLGGLLSTPVQRVAHPCGHHVTDAAPPFDQTPGLLPTT